MGAPWGPRCEERLTKGPLVRQPPPVPAGPETFIMVGVGRIIKSV